MKEIQNIYECQYYAEDENLNKTCEGKDRCVIYYDEYCYKFKKKNELSNP